jgi:hypothetical protein
MVGKPPASLLHFGFTDLDWARVKILARQVSATYVPPPLDDLDVPYRVGVCKLGQEGGYSGKHVASWRGRAILVWEMTDTERRDWERRDRARRRH